MTKTSTDTRPVSAPPSAQRWSQSLCLEAALFAGDQAFAQDAASHAIDIEVNLTSDQRSCAIPNSLLKSLAKAALQFAHESGWIGLAEVNAVSKMRFLGGNGSAVVLAIGHRRGNTEGWPYGLRLAAERFDDRGEAELPLLGAISRRNTLNDLPSAAVGRAAPGVQQPQVGHLCHGGAGGGPSQRTPRPLLCTGCSVPHWRA